MKRATAIPVLAFLLAVLAAIIGPPALYALAAFGLIRWRRRESARENIKLD